jgi:hypothetical protein
VREGPRTLAYRRSRGGSLPLRGTGPRSRPCGARGPSARRRRRVWTYPVASAPAGRRGPLRGIPAASRYTGRTEEEAGTSQRRHTEEAHRGGGEAAQPVIPPCFEAAPLAPPGKGRSSHAWYAEEALKGERKPLARTQPNPLAGTRTQPKARTQPLSGICLEVKNDSPTRLIISLANPLTTCNR